MRRDYDVIIATDFRYPGGTTASIAQEVEVQARMGLTTGLCHIHTPYLAPAPWSDRIRRLVAAGLADVVSPRDPVTSRLLVLRHPRVFEQPEWSLAARGDHTLMVTNHLPRDGASPTPYYDVSRVRERLVAELGTSPPWAPIGPMVREALVACGAAAPELTERDWHNIIDVDGWARRGPRERRTPGVIGRHSRDHVTKWPERRADLLDAYPDARRPRVRILGGSATVEKICGRRPRRWEVFPFGSMPPEEFLHSLDVYVYFHHSGWREAFGRAVLEALAAGLPVVTHPYLERLFGDACVYAEPARVPEVVDQLLRNGREVNQRGLDLVRERYDWQVHRARLQPYLGRSPSSIARTAPRKQRVLFVSSNGGGLGHLTRLLAIARRLPDACEPMFLTMSTGFRVVRGHGYWVDYMPTHTAARMVGPRWEEYLTERVVAAVRVLQPAALVFDGTFIYHGLEQALAQFPGLYKVWSRRPMWRPIDRARARRALEQVAAFDMVLEPGDLAGAVDRGATVAQRHLATPVPPIILLDDDEILSREAARAELGITGDATAILVNLSTGRSDKIDAMHRTVAELVERRADVEVFFAHPVFGDAPALRSERVHLLETYPLARLLRGFDGCVAAAGYNAFHEVLAYGLPTLFVPNETLLDDQTGRARWAADGGLALVADGDAGALRSALDRLLDPAARSEMRRRMAGLPRPDGARRAAELVAGRSVKRPDMRRDLLPHLPAIAWRRTRRTAAATARRLRGKPVDAGPARVLVIAAGATTAAHAGEVAAFVATQGRPAVILAPDGAVRELQRAGLVAELIPDDGATEPGARLEQAAYATQKVRAIAAAYRCGPVVIWPDESARPAWAGTL